jgi:hypothetical protein
MLSTTERRSQVWATLTKCYTQQADKDEKRKDYWLARAANAEQESIPTPSPSL